MTAPWRSAHRYCSSTSISSSLPTTEELEGWSGPGFLLRPS